MSKIIIGANDIRRGESTAENTNDGGFSFDSYNLNLTRSRGEVEFIESPTDRGDTTLTGNVIATAFDENDSLTAQDNYFTDDEGAFYTLNSSTFTKRNTAGGSSSFTLGTVDMLQFKLSTFVTTNYEVIKLDGTDISSIDSYWWTVTRGMSSLNTNVRHPLEKVEDTLYIGDGNLIHTWDGTTATGSAITLPTQFRITSLRKHPDGVNLIAFGGLGLNFSHTKGGGGRAYIIDTILKDWIREIDLGTQVEGSRLMGGNVFVGYGQNIGYFDGNGIVFLKRLKTSTTTYSQNMRAVEDILMVRDGRDVLMYGDLGLGRVWWRVYRNTTNTQNINCVAYKGDNKILAAFSDGAGGGKLFEIDLDNRGTTGQFVSNMYLFDDESVIRGIDVVHEPANSAGITRFNLYSRDFDQNDSLIEQRTYSSQTATVTRIRYAERKDFFQFVLSPSNDTLRYKMFRVLFENKR